MKKKEDTYRFGLEFRLSFGLGRGLGLRLGLRVSFFRLYLKMSVRMEHSPSLFQNFTQNVNKVAQSTPDLTNPKIESKIFARKLHRTTQFYPQISDISHSTAKSW